MCKGERRKPMGNIYVYEQTIEHQAEVRIDDTDGKVLIDFVINIYPLDMDVIVDVGYMPTGFKMDDLTFMQTMALRHIGNCMTSAIQGYLFREYYYHEYRHSIGDYGYNELRISKEQLEAAGCFGMLS